MILVFCPEVSRRVRPHFEACVLFASPHFAVAFFVARLLPQTRWFISLLDQRPGISTTHASETRGCVRWLFS